MMALRIGLRERFELVDDRCTSACSLRSVKRLAKKCAIGVVRNAGLRSSNV